MAHPEMFGNSRRRPASPEPNGCGGAGGRCSDRAASRCPLTTYKAGWSITIFGYRIPYRRKEAPASFLRGQSGRYAAEQARRKAFFGRAMLGETGANFDAVKNKWD